MLQTVRTEYAEFQKTKKIEDLITVKFEVDQFNAELLTRPSLDIKELESHKATLETRISQVCQDFSLVISTERTLTDKVRMFQEKCVNLEQALESANMVSADEIKALRRDIAMANEKNANLTASYDELKKQHEEMLFANNSDLDRIKREHSKLLRVSESARTDLEVKNKELLEKLEILREENEDKEKRLAELVEM